MGRKVTANAKFDSISHLICHKPVLIEGVGGLLICGMGVYPVYI